MASSFTGEGCSLRSRPLGLSGWVTTPTSWNAGAASRARRLAQDNSGVPMKMIRKIIKKSQIPNSKSQTDFKSNRIPKPKSQVPKSQVQLDHDSALCGQAVTVHPELNRQKN